MSRRRSRLAATRSRLRTPRDVLLLARMIGWALVVPALKRLLPLPRLVRLAARPGAAPPAQHDVDRVAAFARWIYRRRLLTRDANCLERSLVSYRFLTEAGADPRLVVGFAKADGGVVGHAWVVVGEEPVNDSWTAVSDYVPTIEFGPDGDERRLEPRPPQP